MPSLFASFRRSKSTTKLRQPKCNSDIKQGTKNGDGPEGRQESETPALPLTVRLSGFGLDAFDLEQLNADLPTFSPQAARLDETPRPATSSSDGGARASPPSAVQKQSIGPSGPSTWSLATARSGAPAGKGETRIAAGLSGSPPVQKSAQSPRAPPSLSASQNGRHQPRSSSKPDWSSSGLAALRSLQPSSSFYNPVPPTSVPQAREPDPRTRRNPGATPSPAPLETTAVDFSSATRQSAFPRTGPVSARERKSLFLRSAAPSTITPVPPKAEHDARRLLPAFAPDDQPRPSPPRASIPSLHPDQTSSTTDDDLAISNSSAYPSSSLLTSRQTEPPSDGSQTDVSSADESYGPETPPPPDEIESPGCVSSSAKPTLVPSLQAEPTEVELLVPGVSTSSSGRRHAVLAASTDGIDRGTENETALPVVEVHLEQASSPQSEAHPTLPQTPRTRQPRLSSLAPATSSLPRARPVSPRSLALQAARERQTKVSTRADGQGPSGTAQAPDRRNEPPFEDALLAHRSTVFRSLLEQLDFQAVQHLRSVSRKLRRLVDVDGLDLVLEHFLGEFGYRSQLRPSEERAAAGTANSELHFGDLQVFQVARKLQPDDYARLAEAYIFDPARFPTAQLRLARHTTRAWNRIALRLRRQTLLAPSDLLPSAFPAVPKSGEPVYKPGRAASLRVWVPTRSVGWMTDQEVVDVEREVWKSGFWAELRKGDVVRNVAIEALGNSGVLIFDGRFLRDLAYTHDSLGHLPPWFDALSVSPSYFHNILFSSSPNPVIYLTLHRYSPAVQESITLSKEKVQLATPQGGTYLVSRYVYRAAFAIQSGQLLGEAAGVGGLGPGGIEVVHPEWVGGVVLEAEGSAEQAQLLLARVASPTPTPWRVVREKSQPGRIWLRLVPDSQ
ncbi:hypothetical protein JCM8115_004984 [Rhodotorula mucilaginosa]|uniref:Uncharacterized protein n=1 Tax=Rhodotorula mucilaginosa TaxID=5537 RepID=A0A9P6W8Q7_RHOMI|nr:hypothetical protein C6P46_000045 [Rhodotorula mucilaginosa]